MKNLTIRSNMARLLIAELGGQKKVQEIAKPISQPAISNWIRHGLPAQREAYFRLLLPHLDVWKKYSPRAGLE